ncbi:SDR family oxidoreductase [Pelomonas sp. KK5]|uniref:SDR family oxidoreductase n=1 Tax=Pelomonas sp. KK5 TaxID=1855730 RepID=UPI00097C06E4|nr:SDR family oxidoreductase [Pelomonas sp. KK5]
MKIALITGASRGIGAAVALACAEQGWDLALNYAQGAPAANALAERIRALGRRALPLQADVSDEAQVRAMFTRIDEELGRLDALVNNAGIVARAARLDEMSVERWQRVFGVNVIGTLLCSREAVKRMSTRHGGAGGSIVNLSSRAAQLGSPNLYVDYAASKGAIDSLTIGLGRELIGEGIRVNGVRPGIIDTDIHSDAAAPDLLRAGLATIPLQRMGTAAEVAQAVCWLLSEASSYTVGATLDVTGGR